MEYDAVVIGSGPGGYECALQVAKRGGKAVVVEKGLVGGVCTNSGCIPTKALAAACEVIDTINSAKDFGVVAETHTPDFKKLFNRRDRISQIMRKGVEKLLQDASVEVIAGEAEIKSKTEVIVGGRTLEAKNIVVATGSTPSGTKNITLDKDFVISGDDTAQSSEVPKELVIIGGGFIGCEYASIYSALGAKVTLIEAMKRILPTEDEDVSAELASSLSKKVKIITGKLVESVDACAKTVRVSSEEILCDKVLLAVGRSASIPKGLAELGVKIEKNGVVVDKKMKTNIVGIYAVGDVTQYPMLAHTATAGAEVVATNIMGGDANVDYSVVPWCVFTHPEISRVGKTAKECGKDALVGVAYYAANGKARCIGEGRGFCKVVADGKTKKILGVHIIGAQASSLIGEAALSVKHELTLDDVIETIHPHPTLCELFKSACENALKKK